MATRLDIVRFGGADDFGVYSNREEGEFDTPLVFRGTEALCQEAYMEATRNDTPWSVIRKRVRRHGHPRRHDA